MSAMAVVQTKEDLMGRLRRHRDEPGSESDVDLLVEFVLGEKSFDHFMAVCFLLRRV